MAQQGQAPLQRLHRLGLLGPAFIGVHAVHMTDAELDLVAATGTHVAHCPTSNLKLASGFAPVAEMLKRGINVGLGTDGAASNNRLDLFGEMRLAALLAKGSSGDAATLPARQALRMATLNGAMALGLSDEIGSLNPGKAADICAVDLGGLENSPCFDPVSHLVHVAGRESVGHVWIAGKCCVDNKILTSSMANNLDSVVALWQNTLEVRRNN
jgi:5-methylthioadenosine/S-adenosylhomocysteine deaminase